MAVSKKINRRTILPSKITKKIISAKIVAMPAGRQAVKKQEGDVKTSEEKVPPKRGCSFCQNKTVPAYTDIATLKRYVSDREKIVPRLRSGVCSKHQRQLTKAIKHARHLALLPFTPKV